MSDPFSDINKEVTLEKIKSLFYNFRKPIVVISIILTIVIATFFYLKYNQNQKNLRLSGYLIEILSIINEDEEKAIKELKKLSNLDHYGHEILSNILLSKIYLNKEDYKEALKYLLKLDIKGNDLETLKKLKHYFVSVAYLGMNDKNKFQENVNTLISFGDYWSLLGHELRGHFYFNEGNIDAAKKDFLKVFNEQLSTQTLRKRSEEMLNNINLNNENLN